MATTHTIIHGSDLKRYISKVQEYSKIAEQVDPNGVNLVIMSMIHSDTDIRAEMLLKYLGHSAPVEAQIDFPFDVYKSITQQVVMDDSNRVH